MADVTELPRVMTVKEVSDYLRVHPTTVYKLLVAVSCPGFGSAVTGVSTPR